MDDLISRRAVLDALDEQIEQCNKSLSSFDISMKDEYAVKVERAALVAFREILEYLPPAQLGTNLAEVGTDCISRQAAIDEIEYELEMINSALDSITLDFNARERLRQRKGEAREILNSIQQLPSAQPEIIRCKDCKHYGRADKRRFYRGYDCLDGRIASIVPDKDFCSRAERREVKT